ncbi:KIF5 [Mytilus coruscus]|uniref:KIF5 n=1 Tax=Mytilus coruscus TaxID=42192 RepID=A0A6J8BUZ5_MYTCO|nr:KIF5 [Mytilus coruscus]
MAEEFIILDPVVENCNVFQDQAIVVKDDGSLQLIHTGAPSSSQATRLNSVPKRVTVEKNKKGVEPNYVPFTASVEVNQQRPDLLAQYNEQLINNQKLYFEQQKAINELTKSEESERDYESSQEDEEDMVEEPPEKRMKVTTKMSKMKKMKKVENILSKKPKLGSPVHEEIAKIAYIKEDKIKILHNQHISTIGLECGGGVTRFLQESVGGNICFPLQGSTSTNDVTIRGSTATNDVTIRGTKNIGENIQTYLYDLVPLTEEITVPFNNPAEEHSDKIKVKGQLSNVKQALHALEGNCSEQLEKLKKGEDIISLNGYEDREVKVFKLMWRFLSFVFKL